MKIADGESNRLIPAYLVSSFPPLIPGDIHVDLRKYLSVTDSIGSFKRYNRIYKNLTTSYLVKLGALVTWWQKRRVATKTPRHQENTKNLDCYFRIVTAYYYIQCRKRL